MSPGKRSPGKKFIGGYIPGAIRDRFKAVAGRRKLAATDALIEAITDYSDKHEIKPTREWVARNENGEDPK